MKIFSEQEPGPINGSNEVDCHLDTWSLFITNDMIKKIVNFTNIQIDKRISEMNLTSIQKNNLCHLKHTTCIEMKAFIGLVYVTWFDEFILSM